MRMTRIMMTIFRVSRSPWIKLFLLLHLDTVNIWVNMAWIYVNVKLSIFILSRIPSDHYFFLVFNMSADQYLWVYYLTLSQCSVVVLLVFTKHILKNTWTLWLVNVTHLEKQINYFNKWGCLLDCLEKNKHDTY